MSDQRPARELDKVIVRLPDGLRDRLNALARENGRSANAEVVKALEAWLANDPQSEPAFLRLPERLRERVIASAQINTRSVLEEIVARVADSFAPVAPNHVEGGRASLRAEIRDAMHEAVEGLLANPDRLKLFEARMKQDGNDEPSKN